MKIKKLNLKFSLDNLNLNKETIIELTPGQMKSIAGGNPKPTQLNCLSIGGGVGCDGSAASNCYSACQTGCDDTFGCGVPTLSTQCTTFC